MCARYDLHSLSQLIHFVAVYIQESVAESCIYSACPRYWRSVDCAFIFIIIGVAVIIFDRGTSANEGVQVLDFW